ncbi:hypothetical protein ACVU7I_19455, partial [Patulibacter sp. S7RM1-6]
GGRSGGSAAGTAGSGSAQGGRSGSSSGSGGASGDTTTGEVQNVKGRKLYVEGTDGTTVQVTVGRRATVQRTAKSTATDVHPGDTVVVQGTTDDDGRVTATAVQATASGVTTLGGFGLGGGAPGGGGNGGGSSSGSGGDAVDQLFGAG